MIRQIQRMMNERISFLGMMIILLLFLNSSCEDFLDIENPKTELVVAEVFNSDLTATAAMANLYTGMSAGAGGINSITFLGGLLADESILYSTSQNLQQVFANNILPSNTSVTGLWGNSGYTKIYQANALLEGLDKSTNVTPEVKNQLMGEALFIRAFLHFYLVNLFGDVPYITGTDYHVNTSVTKNSSMEVYQKIIADLKQAQSLLANDYSFSSSERIIPNQAAATALLARVYLYNGNNELAEEQSSAVISDPLLSMSTLAEAFLKNSSESIWQLKPVVPGRNTNDGSTFILTSTPRFSALRLEFVNAFETGDLRKTSWMKSITVGTNKYYYPYKYKVRTGSTTITEYSTVLRLGEQYLIRAEALCLQNKLTAAINDLDMIRGRAGLPLIINTNPTISQDALLALIQNERRIELFSEWGHRWLDLKRTGKATEALSALKPGWQPTDVLLPIPASEVLVNINLKQNEGYN